MTCLKKAGISSQDAENAKFKDFWLSGSLQDRSIKSVLSATNYTNFTDFLFFRVNSCNPWQIFYFAPAKSCRARFLRKTPKTLYKPPNGSNFQPQP